MRTLILGDSFSNGTELDQDDNIWWKQIDRDAVCLAQNGDANGTMVYKYLCNQDFQRVIVMWTFPNRADFSPHFRLDVGFDRDPELANFRKEWYAGIGGNETYTKDQTWRNIYLMQSLCKDNGVDYIFCCSDYELFRDKHTGRNPNQTYSIKNILYPIDWNHWFLPNNQLVGFTQYAQNNNFAFGKGGHPLDDANLAYGKKMKDWYETLHTTR